MAEAPRLEEEMPHIPIHVCDAIDKALSKKADDRFPTVSDFVAAMKDPDHQYARPSVKTIMLSAEELKSSSGEARKIAARKTSAGKAGAAQGTAAKGAKTVLAGAKAVPHSAPKKSRAGVFAALAVLVLGGGGYAGWSVLNKAEANVATSQVASADQTSGTDGGPIADPALTTAGAPVVTEPPATVQQQAPPTVTREPDRNTRPEPPRRPAATTQTPTQQAPPPAQTPAQTPPAAATPPAGAAPATLRLGVTPAANVTIDGLARGQQRQLILELTPGPHLISVEREGYVTKDTTVTLTAGQTETVRLTMEQRP